MIDKSKNETTQLSLNSPTLSVHFRTIVRLKWRKIKVNKSICKETYLYIKGDFSVALMTIKSLILSLHCCFGHLDNFDMDIAIAISFGKGDVIKRWRGCRHGASRRYTMVYLISSTFWRPCQNKMKILYNQWINPRPEPMIKLFRSFPLEKGSSSNKSPVKRSCRMNVILHCSNPSSRKFDIRELMLSQDY